MLIIRPYYGHDRSGIVPTNIPEEQTYHLLPSIAKLTFSSELFKQLANKF